jgi:hypothetical protein
VIVGPTSVIDIDLGIVTAVIDLMGGIGNKFWVLQQVHRIFAKMMEYRLSKE